MGIYKFCFQLALASIVLSCDSGHSSSESKQDHQQGATERSASMAFVGSLIAHYLHIKDGLIKGDSRFAAEGAKAMLADLKSYKKSAYPEKDREIIGHALESLLDMAAHIKENANDLQHQRVHFRKLSGDIYYLVTSFGYNKPLYAYRCPEKEEEPQVLWITDRPSNMSPYTGTLQQSCGTVPEAIQFPKS